MKQLSHPAVSKEAVAFSFGRLILRPYLLQNHISDYWQWFNEALSATNPRIKNVAVVFGFFLCHNLKSKNCSRINQSLFLLHY
jgi:hypothetical protein